MQFNFCGQRQIQSNVNVFRINLSRHIVTNFHIIYSQFLSLLLKITLFHLDIILSSAYIQFFDRKTWNANFFSNRIDTSVQRIRGSRSSSQFNATDGHEALRTHIITHCIHALIECVSVIPPQRQRPTKNPIWRTTTTHYIIYICMSLHTLTRTHEYNIYTQSARKNPFFRDHRTTRSRWPRFIEFLVQVNSYIHDLLWCVCKWCSATWNAIRKNSATEKMHAQHAICRCNSYINAHLSTQRAHRVYRRDVWWNDS